MKPIYYSILLLFFLSSCLVTINENDFRTLNKKDLTCIHSFYIDSTDVTRNQNTNLYLTEITGSDLKRCLKKYPYTWVYIWRPFCKGPNCKPLFYYEKIDRAVRAKGVKFMLISQLYDIKNIQRHIQRSTFDREIYVMKDKEYGHKLTPARLKLAQEIAPEYYGKKLPWMEDYLIFKGDTLIYQGGNVSASILDSVLHF